MRKLWSVIQETTTKLKGDNMYENYIEISDKEAELLICFIKNHERENIPDDVCDLCMKMMEMLDDTCLW